MTRDGFNLFVDLDLDVDTAPQVIASHLETLRSEWSSRATRGDTEAKLKLSRLAKYHAIAADPARRAEHASDATVQRQRARRQAVEELKALIAALPGPADAAKIAEFVKRFAKRLRETEVRATFDATTPATVAPTARRLLDDSLADRIRRDLGTIGKASLYEFLDEPDAHKVTARSSEGVLRAATEALGARLKNKTDPESTVRQGLVGHCLAVLCNSDRRAEYDNMLALEAIRPLTKDLHLLAESGVLMRVTVDTLAAQAVALGVDREAAVDYLEAEIAKRGLRVAGARTKLPATRVCGHDGTLIHDASAKQCTVCRRPLEVACPKCRKPVPTEHAVCAHCGFRTGDFVLVTALDDEGQQHLRNGRDDDALACYERALAVWPDWQPAVEAKARITTRIKAKLADDQARATAEAAKAHAIRERIAAEKLEREARAESERRERFERLEGALTELEALVEERRLLAAQPLLERVEPQGNRGEPGHRARLTALRQRVTTGLNTANTAIARARRAHAQADAVRETSPLAYAEQRAAAIEAYETVLAACADHELARNQLRALPPPAPDKLTVDVSGAALELTWTEVREASQYRVACTPDRRPATAGGGEGADVRRPPYTIQGIEAGRSYYCAVYADRNGVLSAQATVSGPHLWAADVEALRLTRNQNGVSLHWRPSPRCHRIEVTRRTVDADEAVQALAATRSEARDATADRARTYEYTVRAVYRDQSRGEHRSRGVTRRIEAAPRPVVVAARAGANAPGRRPDKPSARYRPGRRIWTPTSAIAATIIVGLLTWLTLAYACSSTVAVHRTGTALPPGAESAARSPAATGPGTEVEAGVDRGEKTHR